MTHPNKVVQRCGEWIFPQRIDHLVIACGEQDMTDAINNGWVEKSRSKIGASVQGMRKKANYAELTDKGWEEFNNANKPQ